VIGYIVATDPLTAEKAAKKIKIKYEEKPAIVTIEQAIEQESYLAKKELATGNVEEAFAQCDKVIEGEMRTGGQEHFYMEVLIGICFLNKQRIEFKRLNIFRHNPV
jgi:xanthine dehydrogenase/oxidase